MSDASDEFIIDEDLMAVPLVKKARRNSNTKPVHFRAQPNSPPPVPKIQALVPRKGFIKQDRFRASRFTIVNLAHDLHQMNGPDLIGKLIFEVINFL